MGGKAPLHIFTQLCEFSVYFLTNQSWWLLKLWTNWINNTTKTIFTSFSLFLLSLNKPCVMMSKAVSQRQLGEREKLGLVYGWIFLFNKEEEQAKTVLNVMRITHFTAPLTCIVTITTNKNNHFVFASQMNTACSSMTFLFILFVWLIKKARKRKTVTIYNTKFIMGIVQLNTVMLSLFLQSIVMSNIVAK